jgi:hypothetical protein
MFPRSSFSGNLPSLALAFDDDLLFRLFGDFGLFLSFNDNQLFLSNDDLLQVLLILLFFTVASLSKCDDVIRLNCGQCLPNVALVVGSSTFLLHPPAEWASRGNPTFADVQKGSQSHLPLYVANNLHEWVNDRQVHVVVVDFRRMQDSSYQRRLKLFKDLNLLKKNKRKKRKKRKKEEIK